jgi:hypothetical protein
MVNLAQMDAATLYAYLYGLAYLCFSGAVLCLIKLLRVISRGKK